jgi:hypothetical protein
MARPNAGSYRPNPMGVTTLSAVNGPGAYARAHSARSAVHGLSRAERVARARRLMANRSGSMAMSSNGVHRAAFVRRMQENRRAAGGGRTRKRGLRRNLSKRQTKAQREAYEASHEATFGKGRAAASSSSSPRKTPWQHWQEASGRRGAAATSTPAKRKRASKTVKAAEKRIKAAEKRIKAAGKAMERAKTQAEKAVQRENKAIERLKIRAEKEKIREAKRMLPANVAKRHRKAVKSKWPKQSKTSKSGHRARVAYGPFRRASLYNPRRGARGLSYMTRKGKRLRKIPEWAIAGAISAKDYKNVEAYKKARDRIAKRRKAAAARVERGMDAFTPNAGAKRMAKARKKKKKAKSRKSGKRKSTKRAAAARKAWRTRKAKGKGGKKRGKRKVAKRKGKRKSTKRAAAARKAWRTRKAKGKGGKKRGKRKVAKRKSKSRRVRGVPRRIGRRKVRRLKRGLYLVRNRHYEENSRRRRHSRRHRRHGLGRRLHANRYLKNGFAGDMTALLKTGGLILIGFFAHRALTGAAVKALTSADGTTFAGMAVVDSNGKQSIIATWQKPITGLVIGGVGIAGMSMVKAVKVETRMAVSAGMMVSFLESFVRTALTAANQPQVLSYLDGYSNSRASALRGSGRYQPRHLRGLGIAKNAHSIMPQYASIGQAPQFTQAHAGVGEYFKPASGVGEYFAGPGTQGVGFYEKAGPLALMPGRSHMGQLPIDDGIRPDANLDQILDLAESAAGLGQGATQAVAGQAAAGLGEFFTASPSNGGFAESTVPTQSQWIPNGPLWAGTTSADAHYTESELPAGILQGPGGNGVLSGG